MILRVIGFFLLLAFLSSCDGECRNEQIEKVEWITTYEDKTKEILVSYFIIENKTKLNEDTKEVTHTIIIKNNDSKYSNKFAVSIDYGYLTDDNKKKDNTYNSEYVEILPSKTYTFTYNRQSKFFHNFNSNVIIKQKPYTLSYKKRTDELKAENINVNSCEVDIESLIEKYKTIRELYNSKSMSDEKIK